MGERQEITEPSALEARSRALFLDSVEGLSMPLRSRLTQARHRALVAAAAAQRRPWVFRSLAWTPVAGVTTVAVLGIALWFGSPLGPHGADADGAAPIDDLEIVAASDVGSADAIDMLQDDLDFYDFADKAAHAG